MASSTLLMLFFITGMHRLWEGCIHSLGHTVYSILVDKYNDGGDTGDVIVVTAKGGRSNEGVPNK